jgi:hypothetical protein
VPTLWGRAHDRASAATRASGASTNSTILRSPSRLARSAGNESLALGARPGPAYRWGGRACGQTTRPRSAQLSADACRAPTPVPEIASFSRPQRLGLLHSRAARGNDLGDGTWVKEEGRKTGGGHPSLLLVLGSRSLTASQRRSHDPPCFGYRRSPPYLLVIVRPTS